MSTDERKRKNEASFRTFAGERDNVVDDVDHLKITSAGYFYLQLMV
jgi:hypothetical protein